ncbi:MAG TPA: sigma-54-dependent Fis family transcriptional regulator [Planctomycetes bacterium]|nr:sigma-54-dependent Fis family transcriptional regulator [Planctomycetota bacterium]
MSPHRILLFDRPSSSGERLLEALRTAGFEAVSTPDPERAAELLDAEGIDLLLGELGRAAEELLATCASPDAAPELVLFEDFASGPEAHGELRAKAFETLARPIAEEDVLRTVRRALEHRVLREENRRLRGELGERFELGSLVTKDPRMGRILERVSIVAESKASILLTGESGTGKTVLARAIHERSPRAHASFVSVNCGALPGPLLEDELFGHVKGAFTGAVRDREGKFAAADGGTLFLDEIGTAPMDLQVKLLRLLEEGCYERIGENETRSADVRLVSATNANLEEEVRAGNFREDLLYRIQVVGFELPPLRDRPGDIPLLADRFRIRLAAEHGRRIEGISPEAMRRLVAMDWPGNIRQLEHVLERAILLADGPVLTPAHLEDPGALESTGDAPPAAASAGVPRLEDLPLGPLREILSVPERWLIERALREHAGCRQNTARTLGISRSTLFNKMRKYDLLSFPIGGISADPAPDSRSGPTPAA